MISKLKKILKKLLGKPNQFLLQAWLVFPAVLSIMVLTMAFPGLNQGLDLTLKTSESSGASVLFIFSLFTCTYVAWFSSRTLRTLKYPEDSSYQHLPRFVGWMYLHVSLVAVLITGLVWQHHEHKNAIEKFILNHIFYSSVISGIVFYAIVWRIFDRKKIKYDESSDENKEKKVNIFLKLLLTGGVLIFWILIQYHSLFTLGVAIVWCMIYYQTLLIFRGELFKLFRWPASRFRRILRKIGLGKLLTHPNQSHNRKGFSTILAACIIFTAAVFISSIFSYSIACLLGALTVVLLGITSIVGISHYVTFRSLRSGINFHLFWWLFMIIGGSFFDPHKVRLDFNDQSLLQSRQTLKQYYNSWFEKRKDLIASTDTFPVYFILADGGASRSGYWAAEVLSYLDDRTAGQFSKHLFCLSGASGGSFGNATYLCLLKGRNDRTFSGHFLTPTKKYLSSDFLSYTLARMLGPDIYLPQLFYSLSQSISQKWSIYDRGDALRYSLESNRDETIIPMYMSKPISDYISHDASLPILAINTTRMQDGVPGVLSTIVLKDSSNTFGKRLDVLGTTIKNVRGANDIKLSTSVILGARFPYISPGGRIKNDYYVDGGYFDNSGAGFVHEMIMSLKEYCKDNTLAKRLKFVVIHLSNSSKDSTVVTAVNSLSNDLFSPIIALSGSYSQQTDVNDSRLKNYLEQGFNNSKENYFDISLYKKGDEPDTYPMNWSISNSTFKCMDARLESIMQDSSLTPLLRMMKISDNKMQF